MSGVEVPTCVKKVALLVTEVLLSDAAVIALAVLNGIGVDLRGWIGVGNGDRLQVFDGVGECELNGVAGDGNGGDGIGSAIGCDCVGRGGSCCAESGSL